MYGASPLKGKHGASMEKNKNVYETLSWLQTDNPTHGEDLQPPGPGPEPALDGAAGAVRRHEEDVAAGVSRIRRQ